MKKQKGSTASEVFIVVCIVLMIGAIFAPMLNQKEYDVVSEKVTKMYGKYLIMTKIGSEIRVFENTDFVPTFKFNSSDIYAQLEVGKCYKIKTVGWRIHFLSTYENIIKIKGECK